MPTQHSKLLLSRSRPTLCCFYQRHDFMKPDATLLLGAQLFLTYLRTLLSQSLVDLHPGRQIVHLPWTEVLSCGHVDQKLK